MEEPLDIYEQALMLALKNNYFVIATAVENGVVLQLPDNYPYGVIENHIEYTLNNGKIKVRWTDDGFETIQEKEYDDIKYEYQLRPILLGDIDVILGRLGLNRDLIVQINGDEVKGCDLKDFFPAPADLEMEKKEFMVVEAILHGEIDE